MKRFLTLLLSLSLIFTTLAFAGCSGNNDPGSIDSPEDDMTEAEKAGNVIYVAVDGNDADGDGTKEKPYATIPAARDAIRAKKAESGLPDGGITVLIGAGTYRITESIVLETGDSGEAGKPITYKAAKDAEVIIDGGVKLEASMFQPVNEEFKAKLQTEDAKANVVQIDLTAAGCYDLAPFSTTTWGGEIIRYNAQELFADSKHQYIAQWPNAEDGYAYSKLVSKKTGETFENGSNSYYELEIPEGKAELWHDDDIICCALFFNGWETAHTSSNWLETNLENGTFRAYQYTHIYEFMEERPYYLFNIAEELDVPGEYFREKDTNILYYYPDGKLEDLNIVFSQVKTPLVHMTDVSYVAFDGIIFEHGRGSGITADISEGSETTTTNLTVKNCTFRALGGIGLSLQNTVNALVDHNEFYELSSAGIEVTNAEYADRTPSNNVITNNLIHDWAKFYPTANPGITARGMGFHIANNELYNSTHVGIEFWCADSVVEYNILHSLNRMSGDAGAIYNGGRWDYCGNVIRYNYIYDINFVSETALRPNGIYLDDQMPGQYVYGNIIKDVNGNGIAISAGRDMIVRNNIFIDIGGSPVGINDNGTSFQVDVVKYNGSPSGYFSPVYDMDYTGEFVGTLYPELLVIAEIGHHSHNVDDPGTPAYQIVENNVVYDYVLKDITAIEDIYIKGYHTSLSVDGLMTAGGHTYLNGAIRNNILYTIDPGFTTVGKVNDAIKDDSQVFCDIYSFEQIPYDRIGIND